MTHECWECIFGGLNYDVWFTQVNNNNKFQADNDDDVAAASWSWSWFEVNLKLEHLKHWKFVWLIWNQVFEAENIQKQDQVHTWASILGLNLLNLNSVDHMNEQISLSEEFNHETIRWIAFNSSHITCYFSKKIHHKTDQLEITWHNIKLADHWTRHSIDLLSLISFFTPRFNLKIASKRNRFLWELKLAYNIMTQSLIRQKTLIRQIELPFENVC